MPTYEYQCRSCGYCFEQRQAGSEKPLKQCPQCQGLVQRVISTGAGFIVKGAGHRQYENSKESCPFEQSGQTCCGRTERCDQPLCESNK